VENLEPGFDFLGKRAPFYEHVFLQDPAALSKYLMGLGSIRPPRWIRDHVAQGVQARSKSEIDACAVGQTLPDSWSHGSTGNIFGLSYISKYAVFVTGETSDILVQKIF
jgi:hypothetical protein